MGIPRTAQKKGLPERAVEQYQAGKVTLDQLATRMNCKKGRVASLLRQAGVDVPPLTTGGKPADELPAEEIERYREGRTSIRAIARRTGRHFSTVKQLLTEAGLEILPPKVGSGETPFGARDVPDPDVKLPPGSADRYAEGKVTLAELAAEVGCSVGDVRRLLGRAARRRGRPKVYVDLPPEARQWYANGWTLQRIADELGIHTHTLRRLLLEAGVKLRTDAERRKLAWETRLRNLGRPPMPAPNSSGGPRVPKPDAGLAWQAPGADDGELLTPAETAAIFGVHRKTVAQWEREGRLPCVRTLGGHRRYPASVVHQLASALAVEEPVSQAIEAPQDASGLGADDVQL